jgi:hypothetical protein
MPLILDLPLHLLQLVHVMSMAVSKTGATYTTCEAGMGQVS